MPPGFSRDEPTIWCSVVNDEHSGRPLLGAILEDKFALTEAKLLEAVNLQQTKGGRLGEILIRLRAITEEQLLQALAIQFELPWLPHLDESQVDHEWVKKVPIHFARRSPTH
jgi:general secretion pathway protein E